MEQERRPTDEGQGADGAISRKSFVDWLLGTSLGGLCAAVMYPVVAYIIPPEIPESAGNSVTVPFGPDDVDSNTGRIFKFGNRAGLLIRTPGGELRAFSARCTHLDCTVQYREDLAHIWCACHDGHYDLAGRNISGPPPTPLPSYEVNVRGGQIVISKST